MNIRNLSRTFLRRLIIVITLSLLVSSSPAFAATALTNAQVSELVKSIALYPDPLLQQILPASTFPDQIADAALLIRTKSDAALVKEQSWEESVKAIANYS